MRPRAMTDTARWQHGEIDHNKPTSWAIHFAGTKGEHRSCWRISAI